MKKNKTIWLLGGFGNVLFHLFYAFLLRKQGFNVSICPILTEHNFLVRVSYWTIHRSIYVRFCDEYKIVRSFWGCAIIPLIHKKIGLNLGIPFMNNEQEFMPPPKGENLFGYFQNKNQISYYNEIFSEFCSSIFKLLPKQSRCECVVHYRGGDSLIAASHYSYYVQVKSCIKDRPVTIVTDSIVSAREFFGMGDNIEYVSSNDPLDDFVTLTHAKVMFCGPSTFSWWAMHISRNAQKIYIPKYLEKHLGIFRDDVEINML